MPKNVENFEIRTLGRDDYAQAAEIFAFVHALHQANRPDIYRKTNVPLGEDEFFKMCDDPHEIMLYASEAEAKRRGAESLELMVWSFNKSAMRFYESAGMTVRSLVMEKKL